MTLGSPNRLIRCPVKNDGANMATTCHWITEAVASKLWPQTRIASGVAVMTKFMTP